MAQSPFGDFDLKKMLGDLQIPNVDVEGLMEIHRKNMDTVAEINKTAAEGIQALMLKQAEVVKNSVTQVAEGVQDAAQSAGQPDAAQPGPVVQALFETTVHSLRETGEMAMKTNTDVCTLVNDRIMASLEEFKNLTSR